VTRASRVLSATPAQVWAVLGDPHHLPRWWPRVTRVEAVDAGSWTAVLTSDRGASIRADYRLLAEEPPRRRSWAQDLAGTPFERILAESITEARLEPVGSDRTSVTLEARQQLRGRSRLGRPLVRRAARKQLADALEGLERACAR